MQQTSTHATEFVQNAPKNFREQSSKMKAKNTIFKNGLNMKKGIILLQITPQVTPHDLMEIIA
ncbi:hypothetical protein MOXK02_01450 [Moraxella sp. K02]